MSGTAQSLGGAVLGGVTKEEELLKREEELKRKENEWERREERKRQEERRREEEWKSDFIYRSMQFMETMLVMSTQGVRKAKSKATPPDVSDVTASEVGTSDLEPASFPKVIDWLNRQHPNPSLSVSGYGTDSVKGSHIGKDAQPGLMDHHVSGDTAKTLQERDLCWRRVGEEAMETGKEELKKTEEEMRKRGEELKRREEEIKMGEEVMKLKRREEVIKKREEEVKIGEEELKMGEEELKRRKEVMKMGEEELKKRDEELKKRDEELKMGEEELLKMGEKVMKKREEEMKRREEELKKRREEVMKKREEVMKKREDILKRENVMKIVKCKQCDLISSQSGFRAGTVAGSHIETLSHEKHSDEHMRADLSPNPDSEESVKEQLNRVLGFLQAFDKRLASVESRQNAAMEECLTMLKKIQPSQPQSGTVNSTQAAEGKSTSGWSFPNMPSLGLFSFAATNDYDKPMKVHCVVSGKALDSHWALLQRVKDQGELELQETHNPDTCDVIILFCPIVSRMGTDIEAAMKLVPDVGDKAIIRVLLHHTFDREYTVPHVSADSRVMSTVSALFHDTQGGLLQCEINTQAVRQIHSALLDYSKSPAYLNIRKGATITLR